MACRLDGAKLLSEPMPPYCQVHPKEHISMKFYWNSNIFFQENAFEHVVCKMAAILSRGRWIKLLLKVAMDEYYIPLNTMNSNNLSMT